MPEPGIDLIYQNPNFIDVDNLNFNYSENSPCIDSGNPNLYDPDGSVRDIGANIYNSSILGDCNQDSELSILDVVYLINNCVLYEYMSFIECSCSDMNQDGEINVLDVVNLVNIILR